MRRLEDILQTFGGHLQPYMMEQQIPAEPFLQPEKGRSECSVCFAYHPIADDTVVMVERYVFSCLRDFGVDVLGLPHAIMITTANITDRSGAIDMVDYYCDVTNHLSMIKKLLVDGGYSGVGGWVARHGRTLGGLGYFLITTQLIGGISSFW